MTAAKRAAAILKFEGEGLTRAQALQVLAICSRIKHQLPRVVSPVAKARQKCAVTRELLREFDRLGIGTVGAPQ